MATPALWQPRRARPEDAGQIAALFRVVYAQSSHPCNNEEFVRRTLRRKYTDLWLVSESEGRIMGCMGMLVNRWNRTWEIVRGATHPEYRGAGIGTLLAQRAIDHACASANCDFLVGFPRNRTMYRILSEVVTPGMRATGHDGGINIACGRREYHLAAFALTGTRFEWRNPACVPEEVHDSIQEVVLGPLGLTWNPGPYPPQFISGAFPRHPDYGPFTFHYHPFCPSDSLEISGYTGPKSHATEVAADLIQTVDSFEYARHVRLAVLADKLEFQRELLRAGFVTTAYLPAWHLQNGVRYDCVLMVRRKSVDEPVAYDTRDIIDRFDRIHSRCSNLLLAELRSTDITGAHEHF
jgi:GNAT superfamily N-acetyltransferase